MLNARYSDQDVRESEELYQLACDWLREYQGDFPFLVRAKNHMYQHGSIPIATARGVLNCMRSDPSGAMRLPTTPTGRYPSPTPRRSFEEIVHEAANVPVRPAYVTMKATWNAIYVLSTHPAAQVYHVMRPELSKVRWYGHQGQMAFDITVWCHYPLGWSHYSTYIITNDTKGRRICKGCHRAMEANQTM